MLSLSVFATLVFTGYVVSAPSSVFRIIHHCRRPSIIRMAARVETSHYHFLDAEDDDTLRTRMLNNSHFSELREESPINEQDPLYLGGDDTGKYNNTITWVPLKPGTRFAEGSSNVWGIPGYEGQMIVEPRSNLITGPSEDVKRWWNRVPGSAPCKGGICKPTGYYTYPCSNTPRVSFTFGGREFPISPADFNLGPTDSNWTNCVGAIIGRDDAGFPENAWVLGDPFLKNVYAILDKANSRVGFAVPPNSH
ncbi:hypothetical protein OPQ81_002748 [Rhizoctonia solani]|nr:hypothetical protein OPQ81_002748 [Rhizoctonia solani]